ncbi:MAG: putative DNA binding domain-containing protein [candidate division KSB1 bacterium]|nr:putative DNA binding domain-containing protein [candidate division KSB1 bacterium]MDZ7319933.1 putative DNA binding domain-containing protein [candidate division KSB1 bacterium]
MSVGYNDSELLQLLIDLESDLVERKESWSGDAPDKGRQAVCAFANDLPDHRKPGVLFVGAKDDGTPSGLKITDQLLQTLADIKTDGNILPPPSITVEKRTLLGSEMAVVIVQPADAPPVRYKGRIYVRIGPRRGIATAQDERILNEKRRFRDIPFDVHPIPSSTLKDLSRIYFEEEYLPQAIPSDMILANERTYEERLASCKMIAAPESPDPTVLGLLVIGIRPRDWLPGAYIQFLRIDGTELSDPIVDEIVIDGHLSQVLRRCDEKLDSHNRIAIDLKSNLTELREMPYPPVALQQIIRNAVMHRTYEGTNAPVRVYWFSDRIEIHSPGGPFGAVTAENFGQPGLTDYRNPNLADAMKTLGFVQRFGVGITLARAELRKNGNPPPEFRVTNTSVLAIIRSKP